LRIFAYSLTTRVSTSSSETLSAFLNNVPRNTATAVWFLVVFCEQYLIISSADGVGRARQAKPQARARRAGVQKETGDQSGNTDTDDKGLQRLTLPSAKQVISLLAAEHNLLAEDAARIQSELVKSYTEAQGSLSEHADQEWQAAVSDGRLADALSELLSEEELEALMDAVQDILDNK
jgi:polyhydroxyalkanoate synthesis regulator phasin